jgi:hypothetical protein
MDARGLPLLPTMVAYETAGALGSNPQCAIAVCAL